MRSFSDINGTTNEVSKEGSVLRRETVLRIKNFFRILIKFFFIRIQKILLKNLSRG